MKKKIMHNISLKVLSLFIAVVVWLIIINIEDPTISKSIVGINVEVINENAISEAGKCYVIDSVSTVDIRVRGAKSIIDRLEPSDFRAVADLSKYSITNAVPVEVEFISQEDFTMEPEITYGKSNSINITLDDFVTETYTVEPIIKGNVTEGYYVGNDEIKLDDDSIKVSGPETLIKKINKIAIDVDVSDIKENTTVVSSIKVLDSYGNDISSDRISFNRDTVKVSVYPLIEKEIPISVTTKGNPKKDYSVNNIECDLSSIKIAGTQDSVYAMKIIELSVDVSGKNKKFSKKFDVTKYVSSSVKMTEGKKEVKVQIDFKKTVSKVVKFKASDIDFRNAKRGFLNKFDPDIELAIEIQGLEQDVKNISFSELKPYIDLAKLKVGKQKIKVRFENTDGIKITKNAYLEVDIEDSSEIKDEATKEDNTVED